MRSDSMNAEVLAQHLEMLLDANPNVPILLFQNRAPQHHDKSIDKVLAEHPRLEIIFFPTATPDLNLQEHVWKAVRKEVSHNHHQKLIARKGLTFNERGSGKITSASNEMGTALSQWLFSFSFCETFGGLIHTACDTCPRVGGPFTKCSGVFAYAYGFLKVG